MTNLTCAPLDYTLAALFAPYKLCRGVSCALCIIVAKATLTATARPFRALEEHRREDSRAPYSCGPFQSWSFTSRVSCCFPLRRFGCIFQRRRKWPAPGELGERLKYLLGVSTRILSVPASGSWIYLRDDAASRHQKLEGTARAGTGTGYAGPGPPNDVPDRPGG